MTDKFEPGAKVYFSNNFTGYSGPERVDKVYKNGNFTLVGRKGQYRCNGFPAGDVAGGVVVLATPEVEGKVVRQGLVNKAAASIGWLDQGKRTLTNDELQSIIKLRDEIQARMLSEKNVGEVKDNG